MFECGLSYGGLLAWNSVSHSIVMRAPPACAISLFVVFVYVFLLSILVVFSGLH